MSAVEAYHRRFRPKSIAEYIGNEKLKKSVTEMLHNGNRPQVILLQGHSGCGKTTMARLLSKEYCCENRDEVKGACGECDACKAFDEYIESGETSGLMNLQELNSGKIGKAEAEVVMAQMEAPTYDGGWKVFIFDEAHLLTAGAMGGLLKMVEEPPEKVLIIFCTTDPDKMLNTLLSRCQYILTVQKPTRKELCELLAGICVAEGKKYDDKGLSLICTAGDYVPRNTLTSLESVIRAKDNALYDSAVDVLNAISDTYYFKFYNLVIQKTINVFEYVAFMGELKEKIKLEQFIDGLISFTKRGMYIYYGIKVDGVDAAEIKQYQKIFNSFNTGDLANILTTLLRIKSCSDIEANLLQLGFTGIRKPKAYQEVEGTTPNAKALIDSLSKPSADIAKEKTMSSEAFNKATTATEEEVKRLENIANTQVTENQLMSAFNVTEFTGDLSAFD